MADRQVKIERTVTDVSPKVKAAAVVTALAAAVVAVLTDADHVALGIAIGDVIAAVSAYFKTETADASDVVISDA